MRTELCIHDGSCLGNVLKKAIRGAIIGICLKIPLSVLIQIIKGKGKKRKPDTSKSLSQRIVNRIRHLVSNFSSMIISSFDKDTFYFVIYFTVWLSSFPAILCILRRIRTQKDQQALNHGIAGAISGLSLLIDTPGARRNEVSVYLFTRTACAAWKLGVERKWLPSIPHGDIIIFCFVAAITQYTFIFEPDLMPRQFYQFIDDLSKDPQGRLDKFLLNLRRQYHIRVPRGYEVIERSACNTDFYYTGQLHPSDPNNYISDAYKPYMTTGDSKYFDEIESNDSILEDS